MTQRSHLVFGGDLVDSPSSVFKDVEQIGVVRIFPSYETVYDAWKSAVQKNVDNAHNHYFIAHLHRLRDEREAAGPTEELG